CSGTFAGAGLTFLVLLVGWCAATAMLTLVTSRAVLGRPATSDRAWHEARPHLGRLTGLALLLPLVCAVVLAVTGLPRGVLALAGSTQGGATLGSLGLFAGLGVTLWLLVQWSLAAPALMLEKQNIAAAIRRSAKLVRGAWWRVLGVQLLGLVLSYIVASIVN